MYYTKDNSEKYSKFIHSINDEEPVLSSLLERCRTDEIDWGAKAQIQADWNSKIADSIAQIASINPYLSGIGPGEEVPAISAVAWVKGSYGGLDCRPKLFDNATKSYKLMDTGAMVSVVKKSESDTVKMDKILRAVNGSAIKCYGTREVEIRLGRKSNKINAIVGDVDQDILGWDFIVKYRLGFEWSQFGDIYLVDKKAKISTPLKFMTLPAGSTIQTAAVHDLFPDKLSPEVAAFELASVMAVSP